MKHINTQKASDGNHTTEIDRLIVAAAQKQLDSATLEKVWQAILLGNEKAIERLAESIEVYILAVAKLYWRPTIPLEDVLHAGRQALSDQLKAGNNINLRDHFDRFGMWWSRG